MSSSNLSSDLLKYIQNKSYSQDDSTDSETSLSSLNSNDKSKRQSKSNSSKSSRKKKKKKSSKKKKSNYSSDSSESSSGHRKHKKKKSTREKERDLLKDDKEKLHKMLKLKRNLKQDEKEESGSNKKIKLDKGNKNNENHDLNDSVLGAIEKEMSINASQTISEILDDILSNDSPSGVLLNSKLDERKILEDSLKIKLTNLNNIKKEKIESTNKSGSLATLGNIKKKKFDKEERKKRKNDKKHKDKHKKDKKKNKEKDKKISESDSEMIKKCDRVNKVNSDISVKESSVEMKGNDNDVEKDSSGADGGGAGNNLTTPSIADVFVEDLLASKHTNITIANAEKPKLSGGKITFANLKQSTVKEIEEAEKNKCEDGEIISSEEDNSKDSSEDGENLVKGASKRKKSSSRKSRKKSDEKDKHRSRKHSKKHKSRDHSRSRSQERSRSPHRHKRSHHRHSRSRHSSKSPSQQSSRDKYSSGYYYESYYNPSIRENSRSMSPIESHRYKRKTSPLKLKEKSRSKSPSGIGIDKRKLLEIARKNTMTWMKQGILPTGNLGRHEIANLKAGGTTVNELTDFCRLLSANEGIIEEQQSISSESECSNDSTEKPFRHPFLIKEKPMNIVMNIKNALSLPTKSLQEKTAEQSKQLSLQFPVSSGQQHRKTESEWVPVDQPPISETPATNTSVPVAITTVTTTTPQPLPPAPYFSSLGQMNFSQVGLPGMQILKPLEANLSQVLQMSQQSMPQALPSAPVSTTSAVFSEPDPNVQNMDIGSVVSQRLSAMRRLAQNPNDSEAKLIMYHAQKQMKAWAESKQMPGQFTGSTDVRILTPQELASGNQAWVKKDQLQVATPVTGGMGMHLLQKMGWQPGEGLGKNKEGALVPLQLEIKFDKRGLVAKEEMPQPKRNPFARRGAGGGFGGNGGGGGFGGSGGGGFGGGGDGGNMPGGPPSQGNFGDSLGPRPSMGSKPPPLMSLEGKHPVSLLLEYCGRRRLGSPQYAQVSEVGPPHRKNFIFKEILPIILATRKKPSYDDSELPKLNPQSIKIPSDIDSDSEYENVLDHENETEETINTTTAELNEDDVDYLEIMKEKEAIALAEASAVAADDDDLYTVYNYNDYLLNDRGGYEREDANERNERDEQCERGQYRYDETYDAYECDDEDRPDRAGLGFDLCGRLIEYNERADVNNRCFSNERRDDNERYSNERYADAEHLSNERNIDNKRYSNERYTDAEHLSNERNIDNKRYSNERYADAEHLSNERNIDNKRYSNERYTDAEHLSNEKNIDNKCYSNERYADAEHLSNERNIDNKRYSNERYADAEHLSNERNIDNKRYSNEYRKLIENNKRIEIYKSIDNEILNRTEYIYRIITCDKNNESEQNQTVNNHMNKNTNSKFIAQNRNTNSNITILPNVNEDLNRNFISNSNAISNLKIKETIDQKPLQDTSISSTYMTETEIIKTSNSVEIENVGNTNTLHTNENVSDKKSDDTYSNKQNLLNISIESREIIEEKNNHENDNISSIESGEIEQGEIMSDKDQSSFSEEETKSNNPHEKKLNVLYDTISIESGEIEQGELSENEDVDNADEKENKNNKIIDFLVSNFPNPLKNQVKINEKNIQMKNKMNVYKYKRKNEKNRQDGGRNQNERFKQIENNINLEKYKPPDVENWIQQNFPILQQEDSTILEINSNNELDSCTKKNEIENSKSDESKNPENACINLHRTELKNTKTGEEFSEEKTIIENNDLEGLDKNVKYLEICEEKSSKSQTQNSNVDEEILNESEEGELSDSNCSEICGPTQQLVESKNVANDNRKKSIEPCLDNETSNENNAKESNVNNTSRDLCNSELNLSEDSIDSLISTSHLIPNNQKLIANEVPSLLFTRIPTPERYRNAGHLVNYILTSNVKMPPNQRNESKRIRRSRSPRIRCYSDTSRSRERLHSNEKIYRNDHSTLPQRIRTSSHSPEYNSRTPSLTRYYSRSPPIIFRFSNLSRDPSLSSTESNIYDRSPNLSLSRNRSISPNFMSNRSRSPTQFIINYQLRNLSRSPENRFEQSTYPPSPRGFRELSPNDFHGRNTREPLTSSEQFINQDFLPSSSHIRSPSPLNYGNVDPPLRTPSLYSEHFSEIPDDMIQFDSLPVEAYINPAEHIDRTPSLLLNYRLTGIQRRNLHDDEPHEDSYRPRLNQKYSSRERNLPQNRNRRDDEERFKKQKKFDGRLSRKYRDSRSPCDMQRYSGSPSRLERPSDEPHDRTRFSDKPRDLQSLSAIPQDRAQRSYGRPRDINNRQNSNRYNKSENQRHGSQRGNDNKTDNRNYNQSQNRPNRNGYHYNHEMVRNKPNNSKANRQTNKSNRNGNETPGQDDLDDVDELFNPRARRKTKLRRESNRQFGLNTRRNNRY